MFVLSSYVHKRSLQRGVSAVIAMVAKIKLETPFRPQNTRKSAKRPTELTGATSFHTSTIQQQDLLKKMLLKKKKKRWHEVPQPLLSGQSGFLTPAKKKKQEDSQRVRTLNIVVYKAVTDLLASHEVNADLINYSVEITKVSFTADFCSCRIYWKTSWADDGDGKIQQVLDKSAPRIRYLLMSLQILSNVPPVVFVRDKKYAALKEVEDLLKMADYGPSEDSGNLCLAEKDEIRLHTAEALGKKRPLWFGIDHDALYKQIEDYKQQSRDTHLEITSSTGMTQKQLDVLAEIQKKKFIEKKKQKSKKLKDEDITPKAFLLAKELQEEEQEEAYTNEYSSEDSQVSEPLADCNRKH